MKSRTLLIGIIIFLLIAVAGLASSLYNAQKKLAVEKSSCAKEMFDLATESPEVALRLYQLMKDADMVLNHHNIEYWADGGTILGAVRHQGIIPYDDDLDIEIDAKDIPKIEIALQDLEKLGYVIGQNREDWIQIFKYDSYTKKENHLDIFAIKFNGNEPYFANQVAETQFGKKRKLYKNEIFPLKKYQFGEIYISGPNEPLGYIKEYYSQDILTKGCIWPKHGNHTIKRGRCLLLEGRMLEPLKPTGPLLDNSTIY